MAADFDPDDRGRDLYDLTKKHHAPDVTLLVAF
jgi:hypothetical protein